jgi:predicted TIM-barrel fold metal-dependent hydrolase
VTDLTDPATAIDANGRHDRRYIVVSSDSHVAPRAEDLRPYCEQPLLEQFDQYMRDLQDNRWVTDAMAHYSEELQERARHNGSIDGLWDPAARIRDMDADGVAADVIFHGGQNLEEIPFQGADDPALRTAGLRIYNRWLADFVGANPHRHVGVAHIPIWDVELAVDEVTWARGAGLTAVNFPAPRREWPSYNEPVYEPLWAACEELGMPLATHSGSGDAPAYTGPEAWALLMSEALWYSRRGLWYLIWGGVFERHPGLTFAMAEQRSEWVPDVLRHLDSIYFSDLQSAERQRALPLTPSEYFARQCYVGASFMARFEAEKRADVGVDRIMWGTDYPHYEGTWGYTSESIRTTFAGLPPGDVAAMLGLNAVRCYGLDPHALQGVADRIGPTIATIDEPLDGPPEGALGFGFRTLGPYA